MGHRDRLFFFGSFNPSLNQVNYLAPNTPFAAAVFNHGPFSSSATTRSWAGKLSLKITDGTTLDASAFGDPAHNNYSFNAVSANTFGYPNIQVKNTSSFSTWNYGSRAVVLHLASSVNPTTQVNLAGTYKSSGFTEAGFATLPLISDRTNGVAGFQGLGQYQNPDQHIVWRKPRCAEDCYPLWPAHVLRGGGLQSRSLFSQSKTTRAAVSPSPQPTWPDCRSSL